MTPTALEEVATAADEVADDQRQVARTVRAMQRRRDRGWSWARILERQEGPSALEMLRRSSQRASAAVSGLAGALALGLVSEGVSLRGAASRLGVSHQRVSAMLGSSRRSERIEA